MEKYGLCQNDLMSFCSIVSEEGEKINQEHFFKKRSGLDIDIIWPCLYVIYIFVVSVYTCKLPFLC